MRVIRLAILYVTGTVTASSGSNGIITGYRIDHNTGKLTTINGLPVSSGGANPVRAVLTAGSRFLYVLNRGVNMPRATPIATARAATSAMNANITQFAVGGNGSPHSAGDFLHPGHRSVPAHRRLLGQLSSGPGPRRAGQRRTTLATASRQLLHAWRWAPQMAPPAATLRSSRSTQTTGRLSLVVNAQVTAANGSPLTYFPVPANPVDFVLDGSYSPHPHRRANSHLLPLHRRDLGLAVHLQRSSGQLTLSQNSVQTLTASRQGTGHAIVNASGRDLCAR